MFKDFSTIEEALQGELGRRKREVLVKSTQISKIVSENEEIKNIKNKIDAAYVSKQHLDQMNKKRELEAALIV
jgi:hypothetical protein